MLVVDRKLQRDLMNFYDYLVDNKNALYCTIAYYNEEQEKFVHLNSKHSTDLGCADNTIANPRLFKQCMSDISLLVDQFYANVKLQTLSEEKNLISNYLINKELIAAKIQLIQEGAHLEAIVKLDNDVLNIEIRGFDNYNHSAYDEVFSKYLKMFAGYDFSGVLDLYHKVFRLLISTININKLHIYLIRPHICRDNIKFDGTITFMTCDEIAASDFNGISYTFSGALVNVLFSKITKESIKSAISAIMSRNMSHNLGSHYIANTKNYISNLANSKNDQDLRGLSHLLQYIQERMDYIATVISNDVYPLGSLNFKSQIFDELTIDDCGERHGKDHLTTNFLLKYIVFSEKYTRTNSDSIGLKNLKLEINYPITTKDPITNKPKTIDRIFTGTTTLSDDESSLKLELSKLNIAVPCGIMARHALFNIIENIIRNSAKHNKKNQGDLVIGIIVNKAVDGKSLKISIHDNRGSYNELIGNEQNGVVAQRLSAIRFLEEGSSELNKENKGLKEMMISALWLKNENVGDVMSEIDATANGEGKYKLITAKCLQIEPSINGDLAYAITLPIYQEVSYIADSFSVEELKGIHADVIVGTKTYDKKNFGDRPFDSIFTRYLVDSQETENMSNVEKLKKTIFDNLGVNIDDYKICIDRGRDALHYSDDQVTTNLPDANDSNLSKNICFVTHFDVADDNTKKETLSIYNNVAYLDSISGENFTSTLVTPDFMNDEYLRCKVIESALTNIAIIDERIYEKFAKNNKQKQLSFENSIRKAVAKQSITTIAALIKHIDDDFKGYFSEEKDVISHLLNNKEGNRLTDNDIEKAFEILFPKGVVEHTLNKRGLFVYSIEQDENQDSVLRSVSGANTKLGNSKHLADALFLTIHLGLVEKYKYDKDFGGVSKLMEDIKTHFPKTKYISVHSGRGNFSAELSVELKDYCFITLSALEAAVNNSKFMLSQLFYNMNYYGKGNINND